MRFNQELARRRSENRPYGLPVVEAQNAGRDNELTSPCRVAGGLFLFSEVQVLHRIAG